MERLTVSMNSSDIDFFERKRADLGMNKSAFIRLLIANYENKIPSFIKNKEIIEALSDVNNSMKEILISDKMNSTDKMILYEKINKLNDSLSQKI
ncbi:MAG: ribbon-helix-helix domain-containing protein [Lachnospiraceae bacterium]|nr:ribbon-helix-helix domain-containing protein [Lachnospiraceae bacterium]